MSQTIGSELPQNVERYLRGGRLVIIASVTSDGWPNTAPFSWVVAKSPKVIRIGVNNEIQTLENIRNNGRLMICIATDGITMSIRGTARILKESMDSVPFTTAMVEMTVEEVKDDSVLGRVDEGEEPKKWKERRMSVSDSTVIAELLS